MEEVFAAGDPYQGILVSEELATDLRPLIPLCWPFRRFGKAQHDEVCPKCTSNTPISLNDSKTMPDL